jgi:ribosomal-protein-alanine N-acetyltransferase
MRAIALRCRIRTMQAGDIPQVLDIERASFPTMWPQTIYQRELKNNMARYLVAYEPDGELPAETSDEPEPGITGLVRRIFAKQPVEPTTDRIIGMVGLWFMMGEGHIVTIAVRPEVRRMGLGEVLLTAALEAALEAQQEEVTLEYRISNDAARAMYDKYGFTKVGVRARYYTDNQEDAVLMTTPLLKSTEFRRLMAERVAEQRERWGDDYPLADRLLRLPKAGR